jgi:hypothetical protein
MAWIVVGLDDTLLEQDPLSGEYTQPTEGAAEAVAQLLEEGNRVTVWTSRFAPAPASMRNQLKEEIENTLQQLGFPPLEVWTGSTRPKADVFIDRRGVTYDGDWGLALAQVQQMLEDLGVEPGPQEGAAQAQLDADEVGEDPQAEELRKRYPQMGGDENA